jgi:hypothetical protein
MMTGSLGYCVADGVEDDLTVDGIDNEASWALVDAGRQLYEYVMLFPSHPIAFLAFYISST